jgi:hypothetical protein
VRNQLETKSAKREECGGGLERRLGFFAIAVGLLASVPIQASPITWQLGGVSFSDGAMASGTFTYDVASDLYSAWNIVVTPGILSAYDYLPGLDSGFVGIHPPGQVDFVAFPSNTTGRYVRLAFASPLTGAGGTDFLLTNGSGYECDNCNVQRFITSGKVTAVPEPSDLTLVSAGFAMAGLLGRMFLRGRRATIRSAWPLGF